MMNIATALLLASAAGAAPTPAPTKAADTSGKTSSTLWLVGASYGNPQRFSAIFGFAAPLGRGGDTSRPIWLASAEVQAGLAGGGLRLGVDAWRRPSSNMLITSAHLVALRTGGEPLGTGPRRTFLGADVEVSVAKLIWVSAGLLAPLGGSGPSRLVPTWGAGVRFPVACFTGCPF
jgi:hypothetical protein